MNIQSSNAANYAVKAAVKRQPVAFQATLPEIREAVQENQGKLCPGKTGFIVQIVNWMEGVQQTMKDNVAEGGPKKFDFVLGEYNDIPEALKGISVGGTTLEDTDKKLNEGAFSCGPKSDCSCGKGQSLGEFLSKVIFAKILKVPNPEKIELDVDNSK